MLRRIFAAILGPTLVLASFAAANAADGACERWPAYSTVEPSASNIVLARVVEAKDGVATKVGVRDVLRGESPRRVRLDRLDPGTPRGRACDGPPPVLAKVGAALVLALDGQLPGREGRVDTIAVVGDIRTPNPMGVQRLTRQQVRRVDDRRPRDAEPLDPAPPSPTQDLSRRLVDIIRGNLYRAVRSVDHDIRVAWPQRPPAPVPPDAERLDLAVAPPAGMRRPTAAWGCPQALWTGRLGIVDGELVAVEGSPVQWPRGFSAWVRNEIGELVTPDGSVVAQTGARLSAGGGYGGGPNETFFACTVAGKSYGPAS